MNIVHIYWGLSYGGIETMLVNIINEQVIRCPGVHDAYQRPLCSGANRTS